MRKFGSKDFSFMHCRSEFPQFLRKSANDCEHLGALARKMLGGKILRTRTSLDIRNSAVLLQVGKTVAGKKIEYLTIGTSDVASSTDKILVIPESSDIVRGSEQTEKILALIEGYKEPDE